MPQSPNQPPQWPPNQPSYKQPPTQNNYQTQQPPTGYQQPPYQQWYDATRPVPPSKKPPTLLIGILAVVGGFIMFLVIVSVIANSSKGTSTPTAAAVAVRSEPTATALRPTPTIDIPATATMVALSDNLTARAITQAARPTNIPLAPTLSPEPKPTATPTNQVFKVGDTIKAGNYILTVNSVERATSFDQFFKAKAGYIYVALDIIIESAGDKDVNVNPFYTKLKDSQGYAYTFTLGGKDPSLSSENDLPKGQKMRGWVTFEVPQTATGLIFEYKPIGFTTVAISVAL